MARNFGDFEARTDEISASILGRLRGGVLDANSHRAECANFVADFGTIAPGFQHRFSVRIQEKSAASGQSVPRRVVEEDFLARSLHRILCARFELQRRSQRDFCVCFFSQPRCYFRDNQEQSLKRGGRLCGGLNFWPQSLIFVLRTAVRKVQNRSFFHLSEFHKICLRVR
jgi:hypothetical protein